jgi:uncharacterized protein YycO
MFYKKVISFTAALAFAGMVFTTSTAYAQSNETSGTVVSVWNDTGSEFVFVLNKNGMCGSPHFHINRSQTNYKEMVAMVLTALATNKTVGVFVTSCRVMYGTNRNVISNGYILR